MLGYIATVLGRQSIALLALVVAVSGGTAYAASAMFTGANIVDGSLSGADVQNGSLSGADIQDGSIASQDLASTGGGSSGSVAAIDFAGPALFAGGNTNGQVIASTSFSTAVPGFLDVRMVGELLASADHCPGGDFMDTAVVHIDGKSLDVATYVSTHNSGSTKEVKVAWVPAGDHVMSIQLRELYCDLGTSGGTLTASNFHVVATAP
ncbi:MAG TPA: hypothetical protein VLI04_21135 [Nocardioidaceae bacterium]|nr:hypothetical protein [Nocardioidaceae bacterium]